MIKVYRVTWIICSGLVLAGLMAWPTPSRAAVQYVKICNQTSSFYIPGTNTCEDANQIAENQYNIAHDFSRSIVGVAMSMALVAPFIPDHLNHAIGFHWATFDGKHAFALNAAMRLRGNLTLSAGLALAHDSGSVTISTVQPTVSGPYSPVRSWDAVDFMGQIGLSYSW